MSTREIGLEAGTDGHKVGRDPRTMASAELEAIGHQRLSPMKAIRARCLDCCCGQPSEVRLCAAVFCPSWPFRMGVNPWRAPASEAQRAASKANAARNLRAANSPRENHGAGEQTAPGTIAGA